MFSFYHLPSTVMNHPVHKMLYVAYLFYCFSTATPLQNLIYDALVIAKKVSEDETWLLLGSKCHHWLLG